MIDAVLCDKSFCQSAHILNKSGHGCKLQAAISNLFPCLNSSFFRPDIALSLSLSFLSICLCFVYLILFTFPLHIFRHSVYRISPIHPTLVLSVLYVLKTLFSLSSISILVSSFLSCENLWCDSLGLLFKKTLSLFVSETLKRTMRMWIFKRIREAELSLSSLATMNWCPSKRKRRQVGHVFVGSCLCLYFCGAEHAAKFSPPSAGEINIWLSTASC